MNKKINPIRLFIILFILLVLPLFIFNNSKTNKDEETIEELENEEIETISNIINKTNKELIYLAKGGSFRLNYSFVSNIKDSKKKLLYTSSNPDVVYVDANGLLKGLSIGEATITISIDNLKESVKVVSTDKILPIKNQLTYTKPYLTCDLYSKEDNDFLDLILKDRINDAGYGTRAGVVAAARFLCLEFPYRLSYFSENGRIQYFKDGEGRYYHDGLYLNKDRYSILSGSSEVGPACWGCSLYSYPDEKMEINGLDCSGFVTWAMFNGGFDPGDVGAGGEGYSLNTLFYKGDREDISLDNINKIQAGDLVHNKKGGGHIGIVIGINEEKVYVGQASWANPSIFKEPYGVTVSEYTYEEFAKDWNEVMLMDSYYKENGNYTSMW